MGNASLLDVFSGITHVGSQAAGIYSREKKYELDVKLYEQQRALELIQSQLVDDYLKIDPDGKNPYQNDPDGLGLYETHVNNELGKWRDKAAKAGNNSKYYNDQLARLDTEGRVNMGKKVYEAKVMAGRQQAVLAFEKKDNLILNDNENYKTWQEKLDARIDNLKKAGQNNVFDITNYGKVYDSIYTTSLEDALGQNVQETTKADREEVNRIAEAFPNDMPNKAEMVQNAIGTRQAQIWKTNFTLGDAEERAYQNDVKSARHAQQAGDKDLMNYFIASARNRYFKGIQVKKRALGEDASEYDINDRPKINDWYDWNDILGDNPDKPGGGSTKPPDDYLKGLVYVGLRDVVQGKAKDAQGRGISIAQLFSGDAAALEYTWDAMEADSASGNELASNYLEYYKKNGGKAAFYRDTVYTVLTEKEAIIKQLWEKDEANLAIWGIKEIKTTLDTILKSSRGTLSDAEYAQILSNAVSWVNDQFDETVFGMGVNEQTFRNKLNGFKTLLYAKSIPEFNSGLFGGTKPNANDEQSMIRAMSALQNTPDTNWYEGNDENNIRFANPKVEKQIKEFQPEEQAFLERRTGKSLRWVDYQKQENQVADVIGLGVYEEASGAQYKENVVDGKLEIQTRERGADGTFGNWKPVSTARPPQGRAERAPTYTSVGQARAALAEARDTWVSGATAPTGVSQWGGDQYVMLGIIERLARQDRPPANSGISAEEWNSLRNSGGTEAREIELLKRYGARGQR